MTGPLRLAANSPAPPAPPPPAPPLAPLSPLPPLHPGSVKQSVVELSAVPAPAVLHLGVISTDVEIIGSSGSGHIKAQIFDSSSGLRLTPRGNRVDLTFEGSHDEWGAGRGGLDGRLRVEVPANTDVEVSSVSGDIHLENIGRARVRSASGDLAVKGAASVEAQLVSGDVDLTSVRGDVRLRTVSGDAHVIQAGGPSSQLEFGTTSGDLTWSGQCGSGCRIEARTMSGDVLLHLGSAGSYEAAFVTHSGDFGNKVGAAIVTQDEHRGGTDVRARAGKGEGLIEVQTFSGDLTLEK